ncbi:MAG: helix-turn-helix domain-containing protein [bacterium]|nr:helix-turn-helix domain-containing protein [bacterium]
MEVKNNNLHLYSLVQAAKLLGIGRDTLLKLIAQGKIGVIKISKQKKISHSELERYIAENSVREITYSEISITDKNVQQFINNTKPTRKPNNDLIFNSLIKEINNG